MSLARHRKVQTLLRANGESLREGIAARPAVVTLNQHEAERLLGRTLLTRTQFLETAEEIRKMGPETVVLTLGSRGAVAALPDGLVGGAGAALRCTWSALSGLEMLWPRDIPGPWSAAA